MQTRVKPQQVDPKQAGFTLIELMVVVIILGLLAAIALPAVANLTRRARYAEARLALNAMAKDLQMYRLEKGSYPADTNGGIAPTGITEWPTKVPYDSQYDYDHWNIGGGRCYVQVGFAGESGVRAYPSHQRIVDVGALEEIDDNLVMGVDEYDCPNGAAGPIN
ncbi:MAG: prepilin-type N-terminal cleavage/methylation domain-containing protein [Cyanobacteria bacterium P01_A01_bin.123]